MQRDADMVAPHGRLVRRLLTVYGAAMYLFLFVPIVVLVLLSFNTSRTVGFPLKHLTLAWYRLLPDDVLIQDALSSSIRIGLWVTAISTVIGTAAAFPLVRAKMRSRGVVRVLITLPIMIPGLLIGVSLLVLFTDVLKVQPGSSTAIVGQSVLVTPFVILIVAARLQGFDQNLERAASDLGANLVQRMRYVVLPLIAPGILAAALIALTLSIDEFIVTNFLIGSGQTLPIYIYNQIKFGITPEVNALASLMLLATMVVFALGFTIPADRPPRAVASGRRCRLTSEFEPRRSGAPTWCMATLSRSCFADPAMETFFGGPVTWRAEAAEALGLRDDELPAAISPGAAFPAALRCMLAAMPPSLRTIVDVGSGVGGASEYLRRETGATVYAVEPSELARTTARRCFPHLRQVPGEATQTGLPTGIADAVVLCGVLSLIAERLTRRSTRQRGCSRPTVTWRSRTCSPRARSTERAVRTCSARPKRSSTCARHTGLSSLRSVAAPPRRIPCGRRWPH